MNAMMDVKAAEAVAIDLEEWVRLRRSNLYALLDESTAIQTGLPCLW